jgi:hypothetical protein
MDIDTRLMHRRDLLAAGYSTSEIRSRLRAGELLRLRRGAYAPRSALAGRPEDQHVLQVRAAVREVAPGSVISHVSAAAMWGLPVWDVPMDRVHITRGRRSGARIAPRLHLHAAPLDATEVVDIGGITITSVGRTLTDVGRTVGFEQAVVIADAALHRDLITPEQMVAALDAAGRRPGVPQARRALAFARKGSHSVGESRSRVAMLRAGLPAPVLQWEVISSDGLVLGHADFGWPQYATFGEFDGREKYGRLLRPGQSPGDAVYAEKVREDAMRDEDLRAVRWGWRDLDPFDSVAARLWRAFGTPRPGR